MSGHGNIKLTVKMQSANAWPANDKLRFVYDNSMDVIDKFAFLRRTVYDPSELKSL